MGRRFVEHHIDVRLTNTERMVIANDTGGAPFDQAIVECLENCFFNPWAKKFEWWTSDTGIELYDFVVPITIRGEVYKRLAQYCKRHKCDLGEGVRRLIFGYKDDKLWRR